MPIFKPELWTKTFATMRRVSDRADCALSLPMELVDLADEVLQPGATSYEKRRHLAFNEHGDLKFFPLPSPSRAAPAIDATTPATATALSEASRSNSATATSTP